ncbi:YaeQ family protein [Edwardsiella tarda]|uniref:YaeQ family protein n=1 Tax=Edwardsiella tarda TaxID=636 RepID=UPI0034DDB630
MALKATIYKANVNIADMDRHHYQDATLTLAQHPSETEQRMMLRLLAWCCHADERLTFTKGLCADDEPELWLRNDYNGVELWVELGLPDEKRLKKACALSRQVVLYAYSERAARVWWQQNQSRLSTLCPLSIYFITDEALSQLAALATRTMTLHVTRQEGQLWVSDNEHSVEITFDVWQQGAA